MRFRNTVLGRLLVGPIIVAGNLWWHEAWRLLRGNRRAWRAWTLNALACGLILAWVIGVCDIPLLSYVLVFVWPGISLTLLRSFAEHRAEEDPEGRSVVVDAAWPLALLFLNNNLHWLHHDEPGIPWYDLPARYRARRAAILDANGNYRFHGYGEILRRYLFTPREPVLHPGYEHAETTRPPAE